MYHLRGADPPLEKAGADETKRAGTGTSRVTKYRTTQPNAMAPGKLISVQEACQRADEKPAVIIGWCVHHKIGGHVRDGRYGAWMVNPVALDRLIAKRTVAS